MTEGVVGSPDHTDSDEELPEELDSIKARE